MAKIGTAHIEIKPVVSDDALEAIIERIADAVAQGVERGMAAARPAPMVGSVHVHAPSGTALTYAARTSGEFGVSTTTYRSTRE